MRTSAGFHRSGYPPPKRVSRTYCNRKPSREADRQARVFRPAIGLPLRTFPVRLLSISAEPGLFLHRREDFRTQSPLRDKREKDATFHGNRIQKVRNRRRGRQADPSLEQLRRVRGFFAPPTLAEIRPPRHREEREFPDEHVLVQVC